MDSELLELARAFYLVGARCQQIGAVLEERAREEGTKVVTRAVGACEGGFGGEWGEQGDEVGPCPRC